MADDSRRVPKPASPPPFGRFATVAFVGLIFGLVLQEARWRYSPSPPVANLQTAEDALRHGDSKAAAAAFQRLADQNIPLAQYWLAHMDELGLGIPRDAAKAIELYKKAAAQNIVAAETRLGESYLHGDITAPDFDSAKKYLDEAAYHGDDRAAMLLGQMYRLGLGVPASAKDAYAWSEVASVEGNVFARRERDTSLRGLGVDEQKAAIAEAQDILKEIKRRTAPSNVPNSK